MLSPGDNRRCSAPPRSPTGLVQYGQRVAGMEDRTVHEVTDVGDPRDIRVDHRVPLAMHLDVESGEGEGIALANSVHPIGECGGNLVGDNRRRPQPGRRVRLQSEAQPLLVEVVEVLVSDEDGVRAGRRVLLAPQTRVDDEDATVILQAHAGMSPFGELHTPSLRRPARTCPVSSRQRHRGWDWPNRWRNTGPPRAAKGVDLVVSAGTMSNPRAGLAAGGVGLAGRLRDDRTDALGEGVQVGALDAPPCLPCADAT
jgi:hypothetical protein